MVLFLLLHMEGVDPQSLLKGTIQQLAAVFCIVDMSCVGV